MSKDKTYLDQNVLDRVWRAYLEEVGPTVYEHKRYFILESSYHPVSSRSNKSDKFQTWLFSQGVSVKRINKKNYLCFDKPETATMFMLKYL